MLHFFVAFVVSKKIKDLSRNELEMAKSGIAFTPVHGLATSGEVYSRTRNPLYVILVWIMMAVALLINSWWFLISSVLLWAYLQYLVIPVEEQFLTARFGKTYQEYCQKTPRWM
jgi:protein-S-isoprenylcysteine O-methyltransferase Ste14